MSERKLRILCIEDEPDTCELLATVLTGEGYEFVSVGSLAEGLRLIQTEHFDLYILDERLPDGSGLELARQIRQFDPHTPILFESANAAAQAVQQGLEAGAQAYLTKPYDPYVLAARVSELLSDRR
jgi:DNA-binding response OmpR family regulator